MKISKNIDEAARVLRASGVVVYPTDTAYGLAADPFNRGAIKKVYQIKGRNYYKPLTLIAANLAQVKKIAFINRLEQRLIKKYWPGPLTILFKIKDKKLLRIGRNQRIGLRVSNNKTARLLCQKYGKPLTATSANLSGRRECYTVNCLLDQFKNNKTKPDLILGGGRLKKTKSSTIVLVEKNRLKILRTGDVKISTYV